MKNKLTPLAKSFLLVLKLTAASAVDAGIHKNISVQEQLISKEDMEDIILMLKSLEESGSFIKVSSESIENEAKEQKGGVPGNLLSILVAILLGNRLTGKGTTAMS